MLLGGAVIAEQIFALPGIGLFTLQSILGRDYLAVQAVVVLAAVAYAVVNLGVDMVYVWFDPRIRYA
jgi:peptide/nickel transport system permease protein